MKRAIIIGASSGMGRGISETLLRDGWRIGIAARREEALLSLKGTMPQQVETEVIDVTSEDAPLLLQKLIGKVGGMDLFVYCSGIGYQNMELDMDKELRTAQTNGVGFVRMVGSAYNYMAALGSGGHIAVISSIAGVKGLGPAPSYSATKAMQNTYIEALEQQAHLRGLNITFTDIRPGFVNTPLLNDGYSYPMLMEPDQVVKDMVHSIYQKRHVRIIDWRYRLLVKLWHCIPRWLWRRLPIAKPAKR